MNKAMNVQATPLILATLALLGCYDSVVPVDSAEGTGSDAPHALNREHSQLAEKIHLVLKKMKEVEVAAGKICKQILSDLPERTQQEALGLAGLAELQAQLDGFRGLEVALKNARVPILLTDIHSDLRRAAAKARSRMSDFYSLYKQSITVPQTFQSDVDMTGLRVLAEHSTIRLVAVADA